MKALREIKLKKKKKRKNPTQIIQELLLFHRSSMQLVHGLLSNTNPDLAEEQNQKEVVLGTNVALEPGIRFCFSGWMAMPCCRDSG